MNWSWCSSEVYLVLPRNNERQIIDWQLIEKPKVAYLPQKVLDMWHRPLSVSECVTKGHEGLSPSVKPLLLSLGLHIPQI